MPITLAECLVCIRFWAMDKLEYKNRLKPLLEKLTGMGCQIVVAVNHDRDCGETCKWIKQDFDRGVEAQSFLPWSGGLSSLSWFFQVAHQDHRRGTVMMSTDVDPIGPLGYDCRIEQLLRVLNADPTAVLVGAAFDFQQLPESEGIHRWAYNFGPRHTLAVYRTATTTLTGLPPGVLVSKSSHNHGMEEAAMFRAIVNQPQFHGGQAYLIQLAGGPVQVDMTHWNDQQREAQATKFNVGGREWQMFERQMKALQALKLSHPEFNYYRSLESALAAIAACSSGGADQWRRFLHEALPHKGQRQ